MTVQSWPRVKALFHEALDRPQAERAAFIEQAADGDRPLIADVHSLLRSHSTSSPFLEEPAPALFGIAHAPRIPGRIGPYRVLRDIGQGGMGAVYLAARDDQTFEKHVAIKMIGTTAVTDALIERFRHERQILATLDHPHIARLLDGGSTADGLPYVVMEYVDGLPIDAFAERHALPVERRLRLFLDVCAAVAYAHRHLVIHRDLKPQNILVTADSLPKLLDFGIAKLLDANQAPGADVTHAGHRLLTPECASPEQIRGEPMTTASDVYALGVLLQRLLTGRGPYAAGLTAPHDLARAICDEAPRPPSQTTGDADRAARLRGDLDTIVLKALQKDPARRYASVDLFAADVRRHLDGRPVIARPDTIRYRTAKFVARNRGAVAAALAAAVALAGGVAAISWEAHVARVERTRAERRFNDVRQLASSFLFEFHDAIERLPGATQARQLVVAKAVDYLDRLARDTGGGVDVDLRRELADAYGRLGDAQGKLAESNVGNSSGALASYRKALDLARAIPPSAQQGADRERLAVAHYRLGDALRVTGDTRSALAEYGAALEARTAIAANSGAPRDKVKVAEVRMRIADLSVELSDGDAALAQYRAAAEMYRAALAATPADDDLARGIAVATFGAGNALFRKADWPAAGGRFRESIRLFEDLAARHPADVRQQRGIFVATNELGRTLVRMKDPDGAAVALTKAASVAESLLAADPHDAQVRRDRAVSWTYLAQAFGDRGQYREARRYFERSAKEFQTLARSDPANVRAAQAVAMSEMMYGRFLVRAGEPEAAIAALRSAETSIARLAGADAGNAAFALDLAYTRSQLAAAYESLARGGTGNRGASLQRACDWYGRSIALYDDLRARQSTAAEDELDIAEAVAGARRCGGAAGRP